MRSFQNVRTALFNAAGLGAMVLAGSALSVSIVAAGPIVNVAGTTQGCFESGCTGFSSSATNGLYGLTFTGAPFDVTTGSTGAATGFLLGTMSRADIKTDNTVAPLPFTLQVTFTVPAALGGVPGTPFTASIAGTNSGSGGHLLIDFEDSWETLTYTNEFGNGSFQFGVAGDFSLARKDAVQILGGIRNASFTSTTATPDVAPVPVPEPASLLLFGTGLSAAAYRLRRRRQS